MAARAHKRAIRQKALVKSNQKWFEQEFSSDPNESSELSPHELKQFQDKAIRLLNEDIELYTTHQSNRKNRDQFQWIQKVLKGGTIADRLAAITILIQDSAVHNLSHIENLISMVNVKAKRECIMAIETLRDLFISDLLVENRKLRTFNEHPLHKIDELSSGNKDSSEKRLILWQFEHMLQKCYTDFIAALNVVSRDTVESTKSKAVDVMYQLLVSYREKEEILLPNLVNKLGDPMHKVAAKSTEKLIQLVERRQDRKTVVILEVERLLFRPNVGDRAQYYAVCFLNQVLLSLEEADLAARLISMYFAFFKAKVKRNEVDTKMMSALLTGVNRAYPYSKKDDHTVSEHINTMYKVVHTVSFNISVQALMLIHHVLESQGSVSDRYYSALYRKLFSPDLHESSRHAMLISLIFQSLKKDVIKSRLQAFFKRLLQLCFTLPPHITCSILYLLSEIVKLKPNIPRLEQNASNILLANDDDEEEHFVDVDNIDENNIENKNKEEVESKKSSWFHKENKAGGNKPKTSVYDPYGRNPTYCGAEHVCDWELILLTRHFHPSVALFAQTLLDKKSIRYQGDPLQDFTLIRFLDRFVYRNPKKQVEGTNTERRNAILGRRNLYKPSAAKRIPVLSKEFVSRSERMVPVDEMYLYRYLSNKDISKRKKKKVNDEDDFDDVSDGDSVNSDEFEEVLTKFEPNALNDEFEMDFAAEINKNKKRKGKKVDEEDDDDLSDGSDDFEEDEDFQEAFKDYDDDLAEAEEPTFDDDEFGEAEADEMFEFTDSNPFAKNDKRKLLSGKGSRKKVKFSEFANSELSNVFAAAEEFGTLMDENASEAVDTVTMNAFANKDKADIKQLKWEKKRDEWVRGADWKNKKRSFRPKQAKHGGKQLKMKNRKDSFKRKHKKS